MNAHVGTPIIRTAVSGGRQFSLKTLPGTTIEAWHEKLARGPDGAIGPKETKEVSFTQARARGGLVAHQAVGRRVASSARPARPAPPAGTAWADQLSPLCEGRGRLHRVLVLPAACPAQIPASACRLADHVRLGMFTFPPSKWVGASSTSTATA
jgi:hypothetical protein